MKKIKLTVAGLLLAGFSYSQAQDTVCHAVAGKKHFEFNYYESKITHRNLTVFLEDTEIKIDTNEYLVLDLYDNCKCVETQNFIKERKIIVYFRNGEIKTDKNNSENTVLHFDGSEVEKIIVSQPGDLDFLNRHKKDTISHLIAGKIHFEFKRGSYWNSVIYYKKYGMTESKYQASEIIDKVETENFEDFEIEINENEVLVLDLYDDCKCAQEWNFVKERKIIVYFRDGEIKTYKNNSEDTVLHFDGTEIKKVIINKPKLREDNPHDIRRS